jgi:hypothetical protein
VELPTSSCHGVLYLRYYGLVGTSSRKPPRGSRRVVLLSPRVWRGCQRVGTRDWYLMHYSTPSVTGGQKHTHTYTPLLLDEEEDCNNVHKVFLGVPTGLDVHIDVGIIRKLDLQHLRIFLGREDIHLSYVWDQRPFAQLPFLTLRILQLVRTFEGSTHFGVLPESSTENKFLERRLWWDL